MHPIFELWSVTIQSVVTDILHVKHLGVDGNLAGSVLYMLCFMMMDGFRGVEPSLPDIVCNAYHACNQLSEMRNFIIRNVHLMFVVEVHAS